MAKHTVYGLGGFCSDCSNEHDHPLHNIIEEFDIPESEPTPEEKLAKLGLTIEDIKALLK